MIIIIYAVIVAAGVLQDRQGQPGLWEKPDLPGPRDPWGRRAIPALPVHRGLQGRKANPAPEYSRHILTPSCREDFRMSPRREM